MTYTQHPLSAAFPSMPAEEFAALVDDIRQHGQRDPATLLDGMVIDGWHRYRACAELSIPFRLEEFTGSDPVAFVLSKNLHRRQLSASQRAAAVVAAHEWKPVGRPEIKLAPGSQLTGQALAAEAGTGIETIKRAKVAHDAGLTDAVRDGKISVKKAAELAKTDPALAKKVADGKVGASDAVRRIAKPKHQLNPTPADIPATSDADDLAEAKHTIRDLAEENETLRDRLAVEAMDVSEEEKTAAAETITELRAQVKTLEAELDAVKASRDGYMIEVGELKKQVGIWRRKAEKVAA